MRINILCDKKNYVYRLSGVYVRGSSFFAFEISFSIKSLYFYINIKCLFAVNKLDCEFVNLMVLRHNI